MKLPIPCMKCGFPAEGEIPDFTLYSMPVCDDNLYRFTCKRGHRTTTVVQEEKFELLFEIAINAIADGYYREAVASSTSSLERFYEFAVRIILHFHSVNEGEFEKGWKQMRNQSERQMGAYIAAYLLHFKACPDLLNQKRVEFRNEVIHKGRIPTRDESIDYVNSILELIVPTLKACKVGMFSSLNQVYGKRLSAIHSKIGRESRATMTTGTTINALSSPESEHPSSIGDKLQMLEIKRYRG
jgi:hypothetical protein